MELIKNSAEHYFITRLDGLRSAPSGWFCQYFSLSKMLGHETLISDVSLIEDRLREAALKRDHFLTEIQKTMGSAAGAIYAFADLDVLVLSEARNDAQKEALQKSFQTLLAQLPKDFSDMGILALQMNSYQKLADQKLLTAQRQNAYRLMSDTAKTGSIAARRKRRDAPLIMMVEDDRFSAYYASTVLTGEFDVVMCRNAEEAITSYIEKAPDVVFMDIHLPGLDGHEALEAIYAIDHEAFVVMLSVDSVRENIVRATQSGARKFIKKPFTRARLIETIKASPHVRALMRSNSVGHETLMS